jgi:uncharacterized membrane protein YeiH
MQTDLLTTTLDLLGVFANGLLGGAVARTQNMDLFGFAAMGLVSGLGGGIPLTSRPPSRGRRSPS